MPLLEVVQTRQISASIRLTDTTATQVDQYPDERRELTALIRADLRQQGRLSAESRAVPVLVERQIDDPRLAANHGPADQIHYRSGSPARHGIAANSVATVLSVDPQKNSLTVETSTGHHVSYNPALLKRQTAQATVYREEERELAAGDRIQFTASDRETGVRKGTFGTFERVTEDNAFSVRLDNGKVVELSAEKSRHIDYGYAVASAECLFADRVLITGNPAALAEQGTDFARLSWTARELAVYTADGYGVFQNTLDRTSALAAPGVHTSVRAALTDLPSAPMIELEGFGIGL